MLQYFYEGFYYHDLIFVTNLYYVTPDYDCFIVKQFQGYSPESVRNKTLKELEKRENS